MLYRELQPVKDPHLDARKVLSTLVLRITLLVISNASLYCGSDAARAANSYGAFVPLVIVPSDQILQRAEPHSLDRISCVNSKMSEPRELLWVGANSRVTGKPEVIGSSVGLVPRNALVVFYSRVVDHSETIPGPA